MKTRLITVAALLSSTVSAGAVGLDRSGRPVDFIFEEGNKLRFSVAFGDPSITGRDTSNPGPPPIGFTEFEGSSTGNIADSFFIFGGGIRYELNDQLAIGIMVDEPYGADIDYGSGSAFLGGTGATVDSNAITAFARYKFTDSFSAHGGVLFQSVNASVPLSGAAFGDLSGFNADFSNDTAFGFMVGAAYEIPDIALRIAFTYHSEINHNLDTTETIGPAVFESNTRVTTPETFRLDFQSGVAEDTLVFGHVRFSNYSETVVSSTGLQTLTMNPDASLTDLEDAFDASIGVGRRFNDKFSGSLTIGWEEQGEDDQVSALSGINGAVYIAVGGSYQINERVELSGGVRYTRFGDAFANVGGTNIARFENNDAISAGLRIQYSF